MHWHHHHHHQHHHVAAAGQRVVSACGRGFRRCYSTPEGAVAMEMNDSRHFFGGRFGGLRHGGRGYWQQQQVPAPQESIPVATPPPPPSDSTMFGRWGGRGHRGMGRGGRRLQMEETPEKIVLTAGIPNLPKESLAMRVDSGFLVLEAKFPDNYLLSRRLPLPPNIDIPRVEASKVDGKLTVVLPKLQAQEPFKVEIK